MRLATYDVTISVRGWMAGRAHVFNWWTTAAVEQVAAQLSMSLRVNDLP